MAGFTFGKCKTKGAYSAKLRQPEKLQLQKLKGKFSIMSETPILYMIRVNNYEIIVHAYGEIMFKQGSDEEEMKEIASKIYDTTLSKKV